ncbi:OprD family porin [Stutzerimonas tarimensis]|uniref:OprD family porin n=1 Tax=Stutzerimonas tarimensis TaxID=1507735 RepID=A0ABV7T1J4_9GAMM
MKRSNNALSAALFLTGGGLLASDLAHAEFFADGKASLHLRNYYFNGDNRQEGAAQSKAEEWAQGFRLNYESGFTEGPVGFGIDALGMLGIKLDSSPDRVGSGLLPGSFSEDDTAPDDYGQLGLTFKARVSESTLRVGTLRPSLPTILSTDRRLLPQTFRGTHLQVAEFEGLTIDAGRLTRNSLLSESGFEKITMTGPGVAGGQETDKFDFAGVSYDWNSGLKTSYSYGHLDNNYKQHLVNLVNVLPLSRERSFKSDIRYARSNNAGSSNVDNNAFGAMFTYSLSGHSLGLAYQKMSGETGFPHVGGTDAFLVNYVMLAPTFANPNEKSWQMRYDYNFANMGIPGLTFMTRYVRGSDFGPDRDGKEWERDTDIAYVFQDGVLKNLGVKWLNGTYRSAGARKIDQNRLIINYTLPLF